MDDYNQLSHSESLSDLPDILKKQIEAINDFDPFAPINNSFTRATLAYTESKPLVILETVEQPQFKVMQKLGIFDDGKLTDIIEELSEMEVSEFNERSRMPFFTHLKPFNYVVELEDLVTDPNESNDGSYDRAKTDRDYGESARKQHKYKNHQQSSYGDIPYQPRPSIDVDLNCIKDFTIEQEFQHIGKIEIVNNNNYFININGKDKLAGFFEETSFKKKTKLEKKKNNEKDSDNIAIYMDNLTKKSQNDESANTTKPIVSYIPNKKKSLAQSNMKSSTNDAGSNPNYKTFITNSSTKSHFKTPKQAKSGTNDYEENNLVDNKRSSLEVDLYHKPNGSNNNTLNIYKKRYGSIDQRKFGNSIDSLSKKISKQNNFSLSRVDMPKNEIRTSAFRELFGDENGFKPFDDIKKKRSSYKPSDKDGKVDWMTKSDNHTKVSAKQKKLVANTLKDDRLSIRSVMTPIENNKARSSAHVVSTFKRKHNKDIKREDEVVDFYSTIDNLQNICDDKSKVGINGIMSQLNLENNLYNKMSKFATIGPINNFSTLADNMFNKSVDMKKVFKDTKDKARRTTHNSAIVKNDKKPGKKGRDSENKDNLFEHREQRNKKSGNNISQQNYSRSDIYINDLSLKSVQFQPNAYRNSHINNSDISFKSIQLKDGIQQRTNDKKSKKTSHNSKTTVNFLEKNISIIERGKDSNYDLIKVCQTNQKFFEKVKMMSKI